MSGFLNRLVRGRQKNPAPAESRQDNGLALSHLKRIFSEFRHPAPGATIQSQEEKLYSMIPLFNRVFSHAPPIEMTERFHDVLQFSSHVAKLMVSEIKKRATNLSTDEACMTIVNFLEIGHTQAPSSGWQLFMAIDTLAAGSHSIIDCMSAALLPSTLVKCLYLFFDLPPVEVGEGGGDVTPAESRLLLQKTFVQVLVRVCSHATPAEELARSDDLQLLFSAISSPCPAYNHMWRKSAAEVLMTLSRHGLSSPVVQYIHDKKCAADCINNMQNNQELAPLEIVEMFVTVFCFLKDSSEVSQVLLEDFRACDGYLFLIQFLLKLEEDSREETVQALRNLVLLVGSLTTCGHEEIIPVYDKSTLFELEGFTLPKPVGKGISVRNMQAFKVLQSVFIKSWSSQLCTMILEVISSIFHQDNSNYFIVEPQSTLSEFAEIIHHKPQEVQVKYFELIEFIVTSLNFVPCKELNGISLLLKANRRIDCSIMCMKTLLKVLDYSVVYKKVFSEVGLLEVLITCLHRFAASVKEREALQGGGDIIDGKEKDLGFMVMNALAVLLSGTGSANAETFLWSNDQYHQKFNEDVFRQCGGARCAHNLVPYEFCRRQALSLVKQLLLSSGGDDDMGTLLALMQKEPHENILIKVAILRVIISALRESHRARTMFRKVDGFRYIMSVIVSMNGCLGEDVKAPWSDIDKKSILTLLQCIFCTMTVAMRYEPTNIKFFKAEVQYSSLLVAIRLLGCFTSDTELPDSTSDVVPSGDPVFQECFLSSAPLKVFCTHTPESVPISLLHSCFIFRCLYDMAVDHYDSRVPEEKPVFNKRMTTIVGNQSANDSQKLRSSWNGSVSSIKLDDYDHTIIHPGAVSVLLKLLPSINMADNSQQLGLNLQLHITRVVQSLLNSERNQQSMCNDGFVRDIFTHCTKALMNEKHILHSNIQYMFELMAAQSLKPNDLRDYLRLGDPLCSKSLDELTETDERTTTIPVNRVRCIVTMTTPRDVNLHGVAITPPFVEFNMNYEGFGCMFVPSMAPQGPPNPSVVGVTGSTDQTIVGGLGTGERVFPPSAGLSYCSWFCIDRLSTTQYHPVYLLQIVRRLTDQSDSLICLSISLDCRNKALIISTQEKQLLPTQSHTEGGQSDIVESSESQTRIWCPQLVQEGSWQHISVVFAKSGMLKNSSVALYLNGAHIATQKLHYISPNIGSAYGTAQSATSVCGYIGTPVQLKSKTNLVWKQGPCVLIEEALSPAVAEKIYTLGPNYVGCLQSVSSSSAQSQNGSNETSGSSSLVSEDKVMFALHADASSMMTVSKIKKVYNKFDGKLISSQLSTASQENTTPVRVIYNSASHLAGMARPLGAVVIGFTGVHLFHPQPVATVLNNIGGMSVMLGFVAMSNDVEGLYAAVKALVCVIKSTGVAQQDMIRINGYQLLAMLYKKKQSLLNSHILHLTFSLIGTIDSNKEITIIPNQVAFEDLLCDLEVWHDAPSDLQRSLYEHFYELLTETSGSDINRNIMRKARLVKKILYVMRDSQLSKATIDVLCRVLQTLLHNITDKKDVLRFGQFVVSTLPEMSLTEDQIVIESTSQLDNDNTSALLSHNIRLRNCCLNITKNLLKADYSKKSSHNWVLDILIPNLGYDWLMLFIQSHLHKSTVILAVEILFSILSHNTDCMTKFREGQLCGGWLDNTQQILDDSVPHGVNLESGNSRNSVAREVNMSVSQIPGFISLQWLLQYHCNISHIYYLVGCLLVSKEVHLPADNTQLRIEDLCGHFLPSEVENKRSSKAAVSAWHQEPAVIILSMVKSMMNMAWQTEEEGSWLREYPITLLQLLLFAYHKHNAQFKPIAMSADFLSALASTLFQQRTSTATSSARSTPVHMSSSSTTPTRPTAAPRTHRSESVGSQHDSADLRSHRDASDDYDLSEAWTESTGGGTSLLTDHPARKQIIELIMKIILDSFAMPASKNTQVVEVVLNTCPSHCSKREQSEFQTAILKLIMDYLLAADILLGEQAAVQLYSSSSFTHIVAHVFFFTNLVVDKLWRGSYNKDAKEIFEFVKELLAQGKRRTSALNLDTLYNCLNRTILFELSGKTDSIPRRTAVLDSLHRLTDSRSLVFGPGNYELEFVGCLTHCLLELTSNRHEVASEDSNTQWHVAQPVYSRSESMDEGFQLLVSAANRVWQELYVHKKPAIEEALKISLSGGTDSNPSPKISTPDLISLREKLADPTARMWSLFYDNQKKATGRADVERFHSQVQSRLERVGSGVLRLATGKKVLKDLPMMKQTSITLDEYTKWISNHTSIIRELVDHQMTTYELDNHHMHEFIHEGWLRTERELLRERGVWGPDRPSALDKHMLDMTEGPLRMRIKMERNEEFYKHYPYRVRTDLRPTKYKSPVSHDSEKFHKSKRVKSLIEEENSEGIPAINNSASIDRDQQEQMTPDSLLKAPSLLPRGSICKSDTLDEEISPNPGSISTDDINQSDAATGSQSETSAEEAAIKSDLDNHQTLLRILDEGEKIGPMFRCARILGLESVEGILLFGKERYYILDGYTLLSTNQIQDIDSIAEEYKDPIIPRVQGYTGPKSAPEPTTKKMCMKFYYEDIREVLKRRYLLQPIALELFNSDGRNVLVAFPPGMRNKVLAKLTGVAQSLTNNSQQSVAGQKQSTKMEAGSGIISSLISEKSVTSRWERGEINNFQYLMHLNTLAGRSYNDLMQYPVFPWILADYSSEQLDLTDPDTFRDLSKPMGALTPDRLNQFKKRFKEWDDPTGETPAYHYGTHYSSAMIVASYLVRMEPFTQHFLSLQGGHFDLADRMFHTIKEGYESASKTNMADVKELIPEFFYLPDFLLNSNKFELGEKQSGVKLNDVGLPPWAKDDPREFVRVHREALECEYVSAHLHEWIDLIFGYKQQGKAAIEAFNVFHYLFYEGNVDIYSIDDPLKRNAIIGFINNFGQIPKQLFKRPHPQKRVVGRRADSAVVVPTSNYSVSPDAFFFSNPDCLSPNMAPIKELRGHVGQIIQTDRAVLAVEEHKVLIPPNYNKYLAWGFSDRSLRICPYDSEKASIVLESLENSDIFCACAPNSRTIISAGNNTVVNVWKLTDTSRGRIKAVLKQPLYGHTAPVLCMTASTAFNILVSGSVDKTCIIWDLSRLCYVTQLMDHRGPVSAVCINNLTGVIASCSASWLYLWSVNGDKLASVDTSTTAGPLKINCVCMTEANEWDADNLILTGSSDGVVRMWSLTHVKKTSSFSAGDLSDSPAITHSQSYDPPSTTAQDETTPAAKSEEIIPDTSHSPPNTDGEQTRPVPATRRSLSVQNSSDRTSPKPAARRPHPETKQWKRQLLFRSKLTMHTAYERRDNKHPAAITTIACSKDHRTVFVGDEKGRVLSWSMIETSGPADHWVKDEDQQSCTQCDIKFTATLRRHHCRNCGQIFCGKCSKYESEIPLMKINKPVRVCLTCYKTLDEQAKSPK